ncbi:glycosyltransferase family 4 protein [Rubinisphaera sp.]|uniref:glycosyltransferase family 4 protein n=1 Tax=Rubinisphaera sp. TaxID=2024857 RepID=UPI000C10BE6D|nr:glycosyltransferase family 4 protein [Rubinisphaera sp.]MBV08727.1 hypothetical protein [Rubinisphaera sp.]HCS54769.1 hypothetical protein [Planctomycetaceae bacterium]|tara:strand:+ start:7523 stop:8755 length:1233 start_codon:yes stop_codon:yes gene_type:complete
MKIVYILYDHPNCYSGPVVNIKRLLSELVIRGHQISVLILYSGNHASSFKQLESNGVQCRVFRRQSWSLPEIRWILRQVREIDPDVFVPNIVPPAYLAGKWIREAGIVTIGVTHSIDSFHSAIAQKFAVEISDWQVSGLFCISEVVQKELRTNNPQAPPLCSIPFGVPVPIEIVSAREPFQIIYLGRMEEEAKRISLILDTLNAVLNSDDCIKAQLTGEGSCSNKVIKYIEENNNKNRVKFTGSIDNERLHSALRGFSAILLLSEYEGLPGALMDGMACGLVPIVSDIPGGVSELVQHEFNGLVVEPNPEAVVAAVKRLKSEVGLWERLSANARQTIQEKYSLKAAADRWEQFAAELIAAQGEQSKKRVKIPLWFNLPPVHPAMSVEDRRYPPFREWISPWFRKIFPRHS